MRDLRDYHRPRTAEEAVEIKQRYGPRAVYLGGGSDLLVHRPRGVEAAVDIRRCGIDYVREESDWYVIGGGALLRDAERALANVARGMLRNALRQTAPWLIRNAATVAGNIANASPAADSVPALLALDAELVLLGDDEEHARIEEVIEGPHRTNLGDRLITEIRIGRDAGSRHAAFVKLARSASDIGLVNLAVAFQADGDVLRDVRIALGAVSPVPMRARRTEELLGGQKVSPDLLQEAERTVREEVRPISDWRASEEYRRRMSGVLVRRVVERLAMSHEP
jgi:carbon-monoxide dehydrogenase medium subunit